MARQPKPAPELERMILPRLRDEMACPPDLQVIRVDGRWEAFSEFIDKGQIPGMSGARGAGRRRPTRPVRSSGLDWIDLAQGEMPPALRQNGVPLLCRHAQSRRREWRIRLPIRAG